MKLCFGVIDQPYDYGDEPGKTTFDVACDLEERYEIFTHFWEMHKDEIIQRQVLNWRTSWSITSSIRLRYLASIFWKGPGRFSIYFLKPKKWPE